MEEVQRFSLQELHHLSSCGPHACTERARADAQLAATCATSTLRSRPLHRAPARRSVQPPHHLRSAGGHGACPSPLPARCERYISASIRAVPAPVPARLLSWTAAPMPRPRCGQLLVGLAPLGAMRRACEAVSPSTACERSTLPMPPQRSTRESGCDRPCKPPAASASASTPRPCPSISSRAARAARRARVCRVARRACRSAARREAKPSSLSTYAPALLPPPRSTTTAPHLMPLHLHARQPQRLALCPFIALHHPALLAHLCALQKRPQARPLPSSTPIHIPSFPASAPRQIAARFACVPAHHTPCPSSTSTPAAPLERAARPEAEPTMHRAH
ncbi:hypothetical protein FA09DRAFT_360758, partial [Tilletiopsis washingtonensis]